MFKVDESEAGRIENATTANTALGYGSLFNLGTGTQNTGVGVYALYPDVDGSDNTALGYEAGFNASDNGNPCSNITLLGANTFINNIPGAINNATGIGASTEVDSSNSIVLGNHLVTQTDFNGALGVWNGSNYNEGASGQVLQSNGPDVAPTWASSNAWNLNGNSGTTYGTNYIGTADDEGIMFEVDGYTAGRIEDGNPGAGSNWNNSIGFLSLQTDSGTNNNAFGGGALNYNTGSNNVAVGQNALGTNSGDYNTAIGSGAMNDNQGTENTAIGYSALQGNLTGNQITVLGYGANVSVDGLNNATAIGAGAVVDSNNSVVLGNNSVTQTDFNGALGIWTGSNYNEGAAGQVLQSNGPDVAPTWVTAGAGNAWNLTGNSGTTYGTNFIGTTDDESLQFNVDDAIAGMIEDGTSANGGWENTGLGYQALASNFNSGGYQNVAIGFQALYSTNAAIDNTALGAFALQASVSGNFNTAVGMNAMFQGTTGANNVAVGMAAIQQNQTGNGNTGLGYRALQGGYGMPSFSYGTAVGDSAAWNNQANDVTAVGAFALENNSTGVNTAIGYNALFSNRIAGDNVALGDRALYANDGDGQGLAMRNTAVGTKAL
ncbi:MAG TPA: hypothetical protein VGF75_06585, partial [Candidatus Saccharimonadales bacterium]